MGAEQYVWQDSAWERSIRITKGDSSATNRPIGKLVITFDEGKHLFKENAKLAYYFVLSVLKPSHGSWGVYINAQNGQVIKKNDLVHHCINSSVNFTSLYNGAQSTVACKTGFLSSRRTLKREDGNMNIITKRETGSFPPYVNLSEVHNSGTSWGTTDQQFTSSHWAIERSWTYFRDVRGRNGWNGGGQQAKIRVNPSDANAFYVPREDPNFGGEMFLGNQLMSLDISGHEFTHGIVDFTSDLGPNNEPGALNESFADIFGEMIERHTTGTTNLIIGNQVPWATLTPFIGTHNRNLNNPAASCCVTPPPVVLGQPSQPDIFMGPRWFVGAADRGGVHINGGVQNRWFSLLANGGTHNGITVTGIGLDNAAAIAYGNMTLMLGAASGYVDARNGSVAIASFLFGCESNALLQTINAWTAVGLPGTPPALNINGPITICNDFFPSEGTFEACWLPGATYTWSFPSDLSGSVSGANNKFLTVSGSNVWGTFPISVTGALGGMSQTSTIEVTFTNCQNLRGGDETSLLRKNSTLKNEFVVYPNPASEILNIKLPLEDLDILYQVQITNLLGQTLITKQVSALSNNIDIHNLTSGLYHVTIRNTEGVIKHNVKILKQ